MAYAGAKEDTAKQLAKALNTNFTQKQAASAFSKLYDAFSLGSKKRGVNLIFSNGIWIDSKQSVLPSFLKTIENEFHGTVKKIQFSNTKQAINTINKSIEKETDNYIKNFLSSNSLTSSTKMLFTNAILLKGDWENSFPTENTGQKKFFIEKSDAEETIMMSQTSVLPYYENKTTQVLSLPIKSNGKGATFSLILLLPKTYPSSPFDFYYQDEENSAGFLNYLDLLSAKKIEVSIPKFEVNQKIDIGYALQELGVNDAFTAQADFFQYIERKRPLHWKSAL